MTGTTRTYNQKLKVLMDLTVLRAGSVLGVRVPVPKACDFPRLEAGHVVTEVSLSGLAELQARMECDQCRRGLEVGAVVLGKGVSTAFGSSSSSFFSPTCLPCFMEDRSGFYSAALAALVMEA